MLPAVGGVHNVSYAHRIEKRRTDMLRIETSIQINRPEEEVWNHVVDQEKAPNWAVGVRDIRFITDPPLRLGTKCAWTQTFLGHDIDAIHEVTEYVPYKVVTFKADSGPFPITYRYTFEPIPNGTKVTMVVEGEPGGFFKLTTPLLTNMARRTMYHSLENLKDLVEAEALVHA
jgi:uncharacterized protein YndB with AHSA1/START domain